MYHQKKKKHVPEEKKIWTDQPLDKNMTMSKKFTNFKIKKSIQTCTKFERSDVT